jgi:ankyrin repeat protein
MQLIQILVSFGANLQAQDFVRYTALHCAAYFGHEMAVKELIQVSETKGAINDQSFPHIFQAGADPNASGSVHDRPVSLQHNYNNNEGEIIIIRIA